MFIQKGCGEALLASHVPERVETNGTYSLNASAEPGFERAEVFDPLLFVCLHSLELFYNPSDRIFEALSGFALEKLPKAILHKPQPCNRDNSYCNEAILYGHMRCMKLYPTKGKKGSRAARHGRIYWDTAAATPLGKSALQAMKPFWGAVFGNPSSISGEGVLARRAVEESRAKIARLLRVLPREIVFTSGGTEGNNLAIAGSNPGRGAASVIEHPSVVLPFKKMEKEGRKIAWISVDEMGRVSLSEIEAALQAGADVLSIMYANNEIGTVQPIKEIVRLVRRERKRRNPENPLGMHAPYFHVDACQAPGSLPIDFGRMGVDIATLSAQKFYGPKGVGIVYVRNGVSLLPQILGGGHERGLRAGTENVPLIVGMAEALLEAESRREKETPRQEKLRDYFISRVLGEISGAALNGHPKDRLPHNAHISFQGVDSEQIVLDLDADGIAVSSGSACGTHDAEPSYVVRALGKSLEEAKGGVRFTFGRDVTKAQADRVVQALKESVQRHRRFIA